MHIHIYLCVEVGGESRTKNLYMRYLHNSRRLNLTASGDLFRPIMHSELSYQIESLPPPLAVQETEPWVVAWRRKMLQDHAILQESIVHRQWRREWQWWIFGEQNDVHGWRVGICGCPCGLVDQGRRRMEIKVVKYHKYLVSFYHY